MRGATARTRIHFVEESRRCVEEQNLCATDLIDTEEIPSGHRFLRLTIHPSGMLGLEFALGLLHGLSGIGRSLFSLLLETPFTLFSALCFSLRGWPRCEDCSSFHRDFRRALFLGICVLLCTPA